MTAYYYSNFYEAALRVEGDEGFLTQEGKERPIDSDTKIVTDMMVAKPITKSEYDAHVAKMM